MPIADADAEAEMEARIAGLESDVAHIRTDMAEVKTDIRRLDAKLDAVKDAIASTKVWGLALHIALAGGLFGTLARGFGWL